MAKRLKRQGAITGNGLSSNGGRGDPSTNGRVRKQAAKPFDPRRRTRPLIAVFGSSRARRGDELFREGLKVGRTLAANGFDVMTGGYTGVMEAVSQGAHEGGAHVLGITMKGFEDRANLYVMDEIYTPNFYVRFRWLIDSADGWVAMRGGMGTLAEMTFAWEKLSLRMFAERPLVLLGFQWRSVLDSWLENMTVTLDDYRGLTVVETPEKACQVLRAFFDRGEPVRPGLDHRW
jgi:uncharacterized protein (TIGR00730 family)